jgi:hypothetical protein
LLKDLYLDLMKKCLTDMIYGEVRKEKTLNNSTFSKDRRLIGDDWPAHAHTMIGMKRLDNIQFCVEDVIEKGIKGDLIETGVWRGGATIFMRAILKAHNCMNRKVWVVDSFEGFPSDVAFGGDARLSVSLEEVKNNFILYDLLDDRVVFLKGWIKDTLPAAPIKKLAVARLDTDLYQSTMDSLTYLYPKLSEGGYLIVDDFSIVPECKQAILDYRSINNITEEIKEIDWTGIYWQKQEEV